MAVIADEVFVARDHASRMGCAANFAGLGKVNALPVAALVVAGTIAALSRRIGRPGPACAIAAGGNAPLRLTAEGVWRVAAGKVEVFACREDAGGTRVHLATVGPEGLIFGAAGEPQVSSREPYSSGSSGVSRSNK